MVMMKSKLQREIEALRILAHCYQQNGDMVRLKLTEETMQRKIAELCK